MARTMRRARAGGNSADGLARLDHTHTREINQCLALDFMATLLRLPLG